MGKYLITGCKGSGKSTAIKSLVKLGYTAYNTDDLPNTTKLQNIETNNVIEWPDGKVDWSKYAWNWQKSEIEKLLASDKSVFIGAVVSNQKDFYPLFDKVFVIIVNPETLRSHLEEHEHASHHLPGEIEKILSVLEKQQNLFINEGAEPIDGNRPTDQIVKDILESARLV
jgi:broad-specificity NMP kinase